MTCSEVQAVLSISLVPGGIDARSPLAIEEHIAACEGCRAEKLELLRCLVVVERDHADGPDLVKSIEARLREEAPRFQAWRRPVAAAAILVAATALTWAVRTGRDGRAPSPGTSGPGLAASSPRSAEPREEGLLLASGWELRLGRRLAWIAEEAAAATEERGGEVFDERGVSAGLRTDLPTPQMVAPSRDTGDDERLMRLRVEDER